MGQTYEVVSSPVIMTISTQDSVSQITARDSDENTSSQVPSSSLRSSGGKTDPSPSADSFCRMMSI
jgi:hypothetical protein